MTEQNLMSLIIVLGSFAALLLVRRLLFALLQRFTKKTETEIDDIIVASLRIPSLLLVVAFTISIGITRAEFPESYSVYAAKGISLSIILTITVALANVSGRLLSYFLQRVELPISTTSLLLAVAKTTVYIVGALIILNSLGISIAPIITALGVGGLAMALALQDTLSNLFAGIHIMAEQTIRVGDFIRLETGQEGFVEDISWRTTRIRMVPNNMVIMPNNKLSQSVITNYHLPKREMILALPVGVSYASDPDRVEGLLLDEVKKAAGEVPGLLADPAPQVQFRPGFGDSSLDFTVLCAICEVSEQNRVMSELHKRIFRRLGKEGIEFPYPTRTVYLRDERRGG
ncbi:MAG: mechanosensitive ion channel family protein [Nitrospiraceae bacterium]|nr:mechanosensitive ion channel family protein [Nitrospiraceae bacterium]